uniref:Protein RALF-like 34 n=1 Tax=Opuntia streptacantha TaxID=393608 RepID=A0A7C8ZNF8_OPUST
MPTSTLLFSFLLLLFAAFILLLQPQPTAAQIHDWDWAAASTTDAMAVYQGGDLEDLMDDPDDIHETHGRRSLYWRRTYYISYGALSANRVPCPPRSGRSYYTHNCFRAHGPVHPYTRGCSCISRCRR